MKYPRCSADGYTSRGLEVFDLLEPLTEPGLFGGSGNHVYEGGRQLESPLSNAEAAGIRTRYGRRRWVEDDPFLLNVTRASG